MKPMLKYDGSRALLYHRRYRRRYILYANQNDIVLDVKKITKDVVFIGVCLIIQNNA